MQEDLKKIIHYIIDILEFILQLFVIPILLLISFLEYVYKSIKNLNVR